MAEGGLKTAADYHHAAFIFQHGESTADYQKANELAKKGMEMGGRKIKVALCGNYGSLVSFTRKTAKIRNSIQKK